MEHRVQKIICNSGFCSRRRAEELIQEGRVKVNGKIISIGDKAAEDDKITVDGKVIRKTKKVYIMFNKPKGCVTALKDEKYRTIFDYVKVPERVFPIGRLDYNTTGLLLLTNDGDFANKVMHPSNEIKKTYLVLLNKPITKREINKLQMGVDVDGRIVKSKVKKISPIALEISIHEGRNRIVRRLLKKIHFNVKFLERIKIGKLEMKGLEPGEFRILKKEEIDSAFK